ncbi:class III extradiol ring-cleavage dioxygenase [uncultured Desulfobacter sp.]|uniref:DODA-type extradiol aromatic ring-opening family dioxygenase n=1 Tax=uncultured Desulfobacter sp. TaxID=240139 RepID=UPI002AAAEE67|nr:class III extradiol ring-cleavage dioxygenase [uncultured Desulfobacter sp.]
MTADSAVIYIPHGGGPLPLLGHTGHDAMNAFLKNIGKTLPRPRAVVVVSAHWEMDIPVVTSHSAPELIYDYHGFPRETYEIRYPAPGHPELAAKAVDLLTQARIKAKTNEKRGFDHGVFIPLILMLPQADIPCIQISLCASLDPLEHLRVGEALAPLLEENIWLLGSGFSFHNMRGFDMGPGPGAGTDPDPDNQAFQDWLKDTCANGRQTPEQQKENLIHWDHAPGAWHCHPRQEHLLPLMVCAGAAGYAPAKTVFDGIIMGRRALGFLWQDA